jgi:cytochrome c-type biogenesis protein CcmH
MFAAIILLMAMNASPLSQQQNAKIEKLENKLMAPCCYSQTIREHRSQEAEQMREEVTAMVVSGKSDREILDYYKTKYGETILVVPDGTAGALTYGIPIVVFVASLGLVVFALRRSFTGKRSAFAQVSPGQPDAETLRIQRQIRAEIGEI